MSNVLFIRPAAPAPLIIPAVTLPNIEIGMQARHNEQLHLFQECNNVEKAMKQQLVEAIDGNYLLSLRNRSTNAITVPLHEVC